jgi:uncharacterized SAM-binding protein YcdF (DUF218 family)
MLEELGVPRERLVRGDAETTAQEIQVARGVADELQARRVGLVSSAWHLPRVMRQARAAEFSVTPVPCDFRSAPAELWPSWWLPSGGALDGTTLAVKEYLAWFVGR